MTRRPDLCKRRDWTPAEDEVMREQYGVRKTAEIAAALNRSKASVMQRAFKLDLRSRLPWQPHTASIKKHPLEPVFHQWVRSA